MHIVLDFDGTITVHDTIDHLAAFAVEFQEQQSRKTTSGDPGWDARWKDIVDKYLADHLDHKAAYALPEDARTTLEHELAFQRSLHSVDCRSIQRLREARLFAGMAPAHERLFAAGQKAVGADSREDKEDKADRRVRVRRGFSKFLRETATRRQWPVSIVSVNWSDAWIQGVLSGGIREAEGGEVGKSDIRVFANKVTASGAIIPNFRRKDAPTAVGQDHEHDDNVPFASCSDKVEALEAAVAEATADSDDAVVYMGDSTTDLECLVHAGSQSTGGGRGGGIAMANGDGPATSKLIQTLVRLGYEVPHVSESKPFQRPRGEEEGDAPRLAWARDYEEILASKILD
ncbi:hypothetical protein HMPREF1624_07544 [Sporothrix schenckii ATCC 58251]|uniref:Uncharacterized protein n=1 Tax=Sporothrix schenckii (strain ATCC 58251 / de Perez 2211183) TaxID=1391915 RepID=U7PK38_SPOS1|nr:hypothetical protein HMPREF1624_07544 [Sporothrix schenckii ATCC 58251]